MNEEKQYVYIFTRQDISPEQQLVQSAHVALKLGYGLATRGFCLNPDETYFTVVGVRNLDALFAAEDIISHTGIDFFEFREPDIGNEVTSIATFPISESKRGLLLAFSWLRF